jgi:hypothetical protein
MLFAFGETKIPITTVPHRLLFNGWKARLGPSELRAIEMAFDHLIGRNKPSEICTARLLPSDICFLGRHDWDHSPFMRIWEKACEFDRARTCWCFAVFLCDHMMRRPEAWQFKALDLEDAPMAATKYFRIQTYGHQEPPTALARV